MKHRKHQSIIGTVQLTCPEKMLTEIEVKLITDLAKAHRSIKAIARQLHISRNTVRRYLRGRAPTGQGRSEAMKWLNDNRSRVRELFFTDEGNCAVVRRDLESSSTQKINLRQIQRFCRPFRRQIKEVQAFCRYETAPGQQMQIDFGEQDVMIASQPVHIHFFVAVLGFSRRIFAKAYSHENQAAWLDGIESAFSFFGGVPVSLLSDNCRSLVTEHRRKGRVELTEGYLYFCRQWAVKPIVSTPYHPQSKGKVERCVRYVKENALAGKKFKSLQELNQWLETWSLTYADQRHLNDFLKDIKTPKERFAIEKKTLRPIDGHPKVANVREETRKVDAAGLIRVDGNAYQLAKGLAHKEVQLLIDESSISVSRKGQFVIELDKAKSVYKPERQRETPLGKKLQPLPEVKPEFKQNHLSRALITYSNVAGGTWS